MGACKTVGIFRGLIPASHGYPVKPRGVKGAIADNCIIFIASQVDR